MPRAYFDPEKLSVLAHVFAEAKTILEARGEGGPWELDQAAKRILLLAADGIEPAHILADATRIHGSVEKPLPAARKAKLKTFQKKRLRKAATRLKRRSLNSRRAASSSKALSVQSARD